MEEPEAPAEPDGGVAPGQPIEAEPGEAGQERVTNPLRIGRRERALLQHDRAEPHLGDGPDGGLLVVPFDHLPPLERVTALGLQLGRGERRGQIDPGLGAAIVELGDREIIGSGERRRRRERRPPAVPEEKAAGKAGAALRDPIGKGACEEPSGELHVAGIADGRAGARGRRGQAAAPLGGVAAGAVKGSRVDVEARKPALPAERFDPEPEVGVRRLRSAPGQVAIGEQRHQLGAERQRVELHCVLGQAGEPGVQRQIGHRATPGREAAARVQGAEELEERAGLAPGRGGRRIEPAQGGWIVDSRGGQLQREGGQVGREDLGKVEGDQAGVIALAPEPVGHPGALAAGAAPALIGGGAGNPDRLEPGHAGAGRKAGHPHPAAVDHDRHALDGEAGLGDGGGEHHPPAGPRREGAVLRLDRKRPVKGKEIHIDGGIGQPLGDPADLAGAGKKDQQVARVPIERFPDYGGDVGLEPAVAPVGPEAGLDREGASGAFDHGRPVQEAGHRVRVDGGGHRQHPEVGTERVPGLQRQGEAGVGGEAPLVELIEDHETHRLEPRVVGEHPGQHALRHHLEAGGAGDPGVEANPVPDRPAHRLVAGGGHSPGGEPGSHPAGLEHHDPPAAEPGLPEQLERHHGGLARARLGHDHGGAGAGQRGADGRQRTDDRERGRHPPTAAAAGQADTRRGRPSYGSGPGARARSPRSWWTSDHETMPIASRSLAPLGLVILLALPAALAAQATTADITPADLRLRLFALAHDSMGGRATGSLGNFKAAEYVATELRRLGLEPAGDGGTYFQTIPFFRLRPDDRVTLSAGGQPLRLGVDLLPIVSSSAPRPLDGAGTIYGGPVGDSTRWIPGERARGRVVVFGKPATQDRGFGAILGQLRQSGRFADAALIAIEGLDGTAPELVAALLEGRVVTDTARTASAPLVALVSTRAARLLLGVDPAGVEPGAVGGPVQGQARLALFPLDYPARNVVAIRRGSDPALRNTYVSVTGHNDHVGFDHAPVDHDSLRAFDRVIRPMGADSPNREPTATEWKEIHRILDSLRAIRPPRPDSIRNGADDDGTGTVALLEIAERFASRPPFRRSILFVSHTAEEEGLLGSAWFTDHATVPVDSIVAELDMDMIGRGDRTDLPEAGPAYLELIGARRLSTEYGDLIDRVNARQPMPFVFNLTYDQPGHPLQYYCRADHYSYGRYGIPAVAMSRGEHLDYHQVTDEAQYIDYDALSRVARLVADVAAEVGSLDHRPKLDRPKGDPHARCRQ